jgi:hypothetical protein
MHNLAADGYTSATATTTQAEAAKRLEIEMTNLSLTFKAVALDIETFLIPWLTKVTN